MHSAASPPACSLRWPSAGVKVRGCARRWQRQSLQSTLQLQPLGLRPGLGSSPRCYWQFPALAAASSAAAVVTARRCLTAARAGKQCGGARGAALLDLDLVVDDAPPARRRRGPKSLREFRESLAAAVAHEAPEAAGVDEESATPLEEVGAEDEEVLLQQESEAWAGHLRRLVDMEWKEELLQARERLTEWPMERLVTLGFTVPGLQAELCGRHFFRFRVRFTPVGGLDLPKSRFAHGDTVIVSQNDPLRSRTMAKVLHVSAEAIFCSMSVPLEGEGPWRLDVGPNHVAYQRVIGGLKSFETGQVQAGVRRVLLEMEGEATNLAPPLPVDTRGAGLDETQEAAVHQLERKRVSLIQGPPGCGKTRTACALLKAAYSGRPLLAVACSNVAVDQLLRGLLAIGVRAVRFGHPASVTGEELLTSTVEAQVLQLAQGSEWRELQEAIAEDTAGVEALQSELKGLSAHAVADEGGAGAPGPDEEPASSPARGALQGRLAKGLRRLTEKLKSAAALQRQECADILDAAEVVCATVTGCGAAAFDGKTFDVVLMDEASQATEPQALVALGRLSDDGRLVLIGDEKQLPPVCASEEAKSGGLGESVFERLLRRPSLAPAMLLVQYRMHPLLRQWPSDAFYGGDRKSVV